MSSAHTIQKLDQSQRIKQSQRLMALPQMQQALHLLQLPLLELAALTEIHLAQNPIIDETAEEQEYEGEAEDEAEPDERKALVFNDKDYSILRQLNEDFSFHAGEWENRKESKEEERWRQFAEQSIQREPTLFEYLMQQTSEVFETKEQLAMAEAIIGNLSSDGFLEVSLVEIAQDNHFSMEALQQTLHTIQTFEPNGIAATSLQESLLLQLAALGKEDTIGAEIVRNHYEDLIHNRIPIIQKKLKIPIEMINQAISEEIALLDLHPGTSYSKTTSQQIVPDVILKYENELPIVFVNDDYLPPLSFNQKYMKMAENPNTPPDVKDFILNKISSAKWLQRNIQQRHETLFKIAHALAKKQALFFTLDNGQFTPLTMKSLAQELEMHESTIARAVANKYIECPRGLLPLRKFFSTAYLTEKGENVSAHTIREAIQRLIEKEDVQKPYSDADLASQLVKKGLPCARRTIAKYRQELNLGNARQRKRFL